MWEKVKELSFKLFGHSLEKYVVYFDSIKTDLQRANIGLSLTEYVYIMFFTLLMVFVLEFPAIVVISTFVLQRASVSYLLSLTATIFILLLVFFMFYTYPSYIANSRKKNIDAVLPFATTYMATVASSGAPPTTMFRVLGQFKEYGELSKESAKVAKDVDAFGMDLVSSIRKIATRTPSEQLKELLYGLDTIITTGGNLSDYLHEKSRLFLQEYRRSLERYSQTLSLLTEVYLTLIVVGSIFFIVMTALMSIFSGGSNQILIFLQFVVIFIALPLVSVGLIALLRTINP